MTNCVDVTSIAFTMTLKTAHYSIGASVVGSVKSIIQNQLRLPDANLGKLLKHGAEPVNSISKLLIHPEEIPSELKKILRKLNPGIFKETGPEENLSTPDLIEYRGYGAASYDVTTEDGYILKLHRITWSPKSPQAEGKPVVLLQHGLLCSSADWLLLPTERSLGFMLADAGYDVWLGNARGNTYSTRHVTLDTSSPEYWDFSWDKMGEYDIPAVIKFIVGETKEEQLFYVGHSMGNTMFYVAMALHPELNQYIKAQFSLSPVGYTEHIKSSIKYLAPIANLGHRLLKSIGIYNLLSNNGPLIGLAKWICDLVRFDDEAMWSDAVVFLFGFDLSQFKNSMLPLVVGHTPAGLSVNTLIHYGQEINSGRFCYFDYGQKKNQDVYGQNEPPCFDLRQITAPIYLISGQNDFLATKTDVAHLSSQLPNVIQNFEVPYSQWNHMDFVYGIDAHTYVYDYILQWMKEY